MTILSDHHAPASEEDAARIATAFAAVRRVFPTATRVTVSSSDQGTGGYLLYDVTWVQSTPQGERERITDEGPQLSELEEEVFEELTWLGWGAFGDRNEESTFEVDLTTARIVR